MTGFKLLLAFSLLSGVFAEQCDISEIDIESLQETVTVTNTSSDTTALVVVTLDRGKFVWRIPAGQSRSASGFFATGYAIIVTPPDSRDLYSYRESLEQARDTLLAVSQAPDAESDVVDVVVAFDTVVGALAQVDANIGGQACSGTFEPGVEAHATVSLEKGPTLEDLWVLDCG